MTPSQNGPRMTEKSKHFDAIVSGTRHTKSHTGAAGTFGEPQRDKLWKSAHASESIAKRTA